MTATVLRFIRLFCWFFTYN